MLRKATLETIDEEGSVSENVNVQRATTSSGGKPSIRARFQAA